MSDVLKRIQSELDAFAEKKKVLVEDLKKEFPKLFIETFAKAKTFESVGWSQYTPYFNDGESCEFSANTGYLYIDGEYVDEREDLEPYIWGKLLTEEDKAYHDMISDSLGQAHMKSRKIGDDGRVKNPDYNEAEAAVYNTIKDTLLSIPDEFLLELFGDHTKVTINKDGTITTEEYEHD